MTHMLNRRILLRQASLAAAAAYFTPWSKLVIGGENAIAETSSGRVRGVVVETVNVFKGIPYGGPTSGRNRFMPPVKPAPWTGTRDALAYGPTAPQAGDNSGTTASSQSEDCLLLNVFTPGLKDGRKRPVIVWLHGGGFSTGSGSGRIIDGTSLAGTHDTVVVVPLLIRWCRLGQRVGAREDNHHRQRGKYSHFSSSQRHGHGHEDRPENHHGNPRQPRVMARNPSKGMAQDEQHRDSDGIGDSQGRPGVAHDHERYRHRKRGHEHQ